MISLYRIINACHITPELEENALVGLDSVGMATEDVWEWAGSATNELEEGTTSLLTNRVVC